MNLVIIITNSNYLGFFFSTEVIYGNKRNRKKYYKKI